MCLAVSLSVFKRGQLDALRGSVIFHDSGDQDIVWRRLQEPRCVESHFTLSNATTQMLQGPAG
jgi:hypothetical protein